MSKAAILMQAVLVSLSGALSPGPMTAVTIKKGFESPHAGALIAIGHGIVEFPLMIAIFYGISAFFIRPSVKTAIALMGGFLLMYMGLGVLKKRNVFEVHEKHIAFSPLFAGIFLAASNPYFIVWWATVGTTLIAYTTKFGNLFFIIFMICHWMCDFVWYYFLSFLVYKGKRFLGVRFYYIISIICGVALIAMGLRFLYDGTINYLTLR